MRRNLDIASLRSFVTVLDTGGVTRAAEQLHLTQSAVSMQIKRLEEALGLGLLRKVGRNVEPTSQGEELARHARRVVAEDGALWNAMTVPKYEGELRLGVPHDILYPQIPNVLRAFDRDFPRVQLTLIDGYTVLLKEELKHGKLDLALSTERQVERSGEELCPLELVWCGATDGIAWERSPVPLGNCSRCIFRQDVIEAMDTEGLPWEMAYETEHEQTAVAVAASDRSIMVQPRGAYGEHLAEIQHGGKLPSLPQYKVGMYLKSGKNTDLAQELARYLRVAYA